MITFANVIIVLVNRVIDCVKIQKNTFILIKEKNIKEAIASF